jgi:hypothetical protein
LLAGFAFSAIIVLLRPRRADIRPDGVIPTLLVAFMALLISTLTYSVLAGEQNAHGRAAAEEVLDGLPFALAIMMLLHGVSQLIASSPGIELVAVRTSRALTGIITPTLAMFYLTSGAADTEHARIAARRVTDSSYCGDLDPVSTVGLVLVALLGVLLACAWVFRPPRRWLTWSYAQRSRVPVSVLWVSVGSALLVGLVSLQEPGFLLAEWVLLVFLAAAWLLFAVLGLLILWGQPTAPPLPTTSAPGTDRMTTHA